MHTHDLSRFEIVAREDHSDVTYSSKSITR